jgi:hypothetical protein
MPFKDAVPYAISRATFFRRGWNKLDLHRMGWLDFGIRIPTRLRELMEEWLRRKADERNRGKPPCGSHLPVAAATG